MPLPCQFDSLLLLSICVPNSILGLVFTSVLTPLAPLVSSFLFGLAEALAEVLAEALAEDVPANGAEADDLDG